jgi:NAD(P)-dependent dehydrogenase (short-subunit alcohol dehydrogenase family)
VAADELPQPAIAHSCFSLAAWQGAFAAAKAGLRALSQSMARELGPKGIHVAHVVVDGGIHGQCLPTRAPQLAEQRGPDGMLSIEAIADTYWVLHNQHRSAWTLEIDVRPWAEPF